MNVAHVGRFVIVKPSELPSGSEAVGLKLYELPTVTEVAGVPEIVGARFEPDDFTAIEKRGNALAFTPSHA